MQLSIGLSLVDSITDQIVVDCIHSGFAAVHTSLLWSISGIQAISESIRLYSRLHDAYVKLSEAGKILTICQCTLSVKLTQGN